MSWGMRQWTEREIRELVREEIGKAQFTPHGYDPIRGRFMQDANGVYYWPDPRPKWLDDEMLAKITDAPKPKTDLERAAEIADRFAARRTEPGGEYTDGYWCAATGIAREICALKPSPDREAQATRWRKIAEGLYAAVYEEGKRSPMWARSTMAALEAYDAAVKEKP